MSRPAPFKFRLYVAGDAQNSMLARANLAAFCKEYLPDRYQIEVVDVLKQPQRALADSIFMTPTLVALTPPPFRKIVGTLAHTQALLTALGLGTLIT